MSKVRKIHTAYVTRDSGYIQLVHNSPFTGQYPDEITSSEPSKVKKDSEDQVDKTVRKSCSVLNQFDCCNYPFSMLFEKYKYGIGSKHIYTKGGFMARHRDKRMADLNGLPHTMTLIVVNRDFRGGQLIVDGVDVIDEYNKVERSSSGYGDKYLIMFPITSVHEVKEVTDGVRHSFVFPVYGVPCLNGFKKLFEPAASTIYDEVIKLLEEPMRDSDSDSDSRDTRNPTEETRDIHSDSDSQLNSDKKIIVGIEYIKNAIDLLNSQLLTSLLKQLAIVQNKCWSPDYDRYDDYDSDEPNYDKQCVLKEYENNQIEVSYIIEGNRVKVNLTDYFEVPTQATNVVFRSISNKPDENEVSRIILRKMISIITDMKEEHFKPTEQKEITIDIQTLPETPFIYMATNCYYSDTVESQLYGVDAEFYNFCKSQGKTILIKYISNKSLEKCTGLYKLYYIANNQLELANLTDLPESSILADFSMEFDDQGSYDPRYTRMVCVMLIE